MSARLWRHLCWSPLRAGGRRILGAPTTDRGMGRGRLGSRMSDRLAGSAVSLRQSLFHLPAFRTLVLNFTPPHHLPMSDKERKTLEFMSELRKLFVLLLSSQEKYVDQQGCGDLEREPWGGEGWRGTSSQ